MLRYLPVVVSVLALACTETCPEGSHFAALPGGGFARECTPIADLDGGIDGGGTDGGPVDASPDAGPDSGPVDAGPCGMECTGGTPVCDSASGDCVQCTADMDGACEGGTPFCGASNTCVACLADTDCTTAAAARCDATGTCVGCDDSDQCEGITGTEVCDVPSTTCVECTATERDACGLNVCDSATNLCTTRPARDKGLCEDCVADEECQEGQLCVAMTFMSTDIGQFCLWRLDAPMPPGPGGSCTAVRPYRMQEEMTSVDDVTADVCSLRQTTCPALNQFDAMSCTTPFASDDECGFGGVDDGLCRMVDAVTNRCTIPCLSNDDCPSGSTCDTGATPRFCEF